MKELIKPNKIEQLTSDIESYCEDQRTTCGTYTTHPCGGGGENNSVDDEYEIIF